MNDAKQSKKIFNTSNGLLHKLFLSEEKPIDVRLFNMVCLSGILIALITGIVRGILQVHWMASAIMILVMASYALLIFLVNKPTPNVLFLCICMLFVGNILFPICFFLLGGINSSVALYFSLILAVTFLSTEGKICALLTFINVLTFTGTFICSYLFPQLVVPTNDLVRYVDVIQSIIVVGLFVGAFFKFQSYLYEKQKLRADSMMRDLTKQDARLRVINEVAISMLHSDTTDFEADLRKCMKSTANCVGADRMIIWKHIPKDDASYCCRLYDWSRKSAKHGLKLNEVRLLEQTLHGWEKNMFAGEIVQSCTKDCNPIMRKQLEEQHVLATLLVPVILNETFWGFLAFYNTKSERLFTDTEITILNSSSHLFGNALMRNETLNDLITAKEKAISGTRAKSDFLSNMSHEMRTPLNAIIGMTSIAHSSKDIEKKDYCLDKIEGASTHLLAVINDILDMSKIEANKLELSPTIFSFENMLQNVVNVIAFKVEEKSQEFTVHIDPQIPEALYADEQRLAQVITNLLANAVKFTPTGGLIEMDTKLLSEQNGIYEIEISVQDSGIGITKEQISQLFSAFQQADNSISRQFGGTGLGLAISKKIVEMMDGQIQVASDYGHGATFFFTIKAKKGEVDTPSLTPEHAPLDLQSLKVLAVDDVEEVRVYFRGIFKQFQISCTTAQNSEEALLACQQQHFDICFIDWKMPGMDGIELSQRIHTLYPKTKLVMISASEWSTFSDKAIAAGVDAFLPKPLFPSALMDCITSQLGREYVVSAQANVAQENYSFSGYCVLLVEDVELNREIAITLLEPTNLQIDIAVDGQEALDIFTANQEKYDLILMDMQMPRMDGYEATKCIRALNSEKAKAIPIIAMTANVFKEDVEKCLEAGMNDHVGKPINMTILLQKLKHYLNN